MNDVENNTIWIINPFSIRRTFFMLRPAIRKYMEVLKNARNVD